MKPVSSFLLITLSLVLLPHAASAQMSAAARHTLFIPGFSVVSAEQEAFNFQIDPATGVAETVSSLTYKTNRAYQTVSVHVEGDMTGLEVLVEQDAGGMNVLGKAASGTIGDTSPVTFQSPGSLPLVTNVAGAGVEMNVRYTVVAVSPQAASNARDLRIFYTIN